MANKQKDKGNGKRQQLCWDCQRALPRRGCSWADKFEPVKGWTATPKVMSGGIHTFAITKCPLFIPDKPKPVKKEYKMKAVIRLFTIDGEFIMEYRTASEVARALGVSGTTIYRMLKTQLKSDEYILRKVNKVEKEDF